MSVTLYHVGRTPGQQQFGLATFTEHYKANEAADLVKISDDVPQQGDAHPDYEFMFVTDVYVSETGPSASSLDVTYMGCMTDDEGDPILPPSKNSKGRAIQSATTYTSSAIFPAVASVPASLQYYAPTNSMVIWSTTDTSATEPDDPPDITTADLITWTLAAEQPAGTVDAIATFLLENAFVQRITEVTDAEEIVAGQYWQITKRKTKILLPYAPSS